VFLVLRASVPRIDAAVQNLALVETHQKFINTEALFQNIPDLEQRVGALRASHSSHAEEAGILDQQIENLLEHFQLSVRQTSAGLLRCDALVSELEKRRKALAERN
jgi:hypothetical protein